MSLVHTDITLKNAYDRALVQNGLRQDVRQLKVTALVDTGASDLVISEGLRAQLGLKVDKKTPVTLADGSQEMRDVTEPVEIHWKDRSAISWAMVLPDADEVLLGALPLESMDLIVHPKTAEVVGAHGDTAREVVY
jgi:clan AA aspartic protease